MKIKKLEPQAITDKTLGYKEYRKVVKPALKKMITEHNTPETATQFIVKTNFEFSEMKGKKMGMVILGDHTAGWLKLAKEQVKDDKKNTCLGTCYAKKNADGSYTLVLLPEKGAAKKNLMIKQLEKFAIKGTPFKIEIGAGGELEDDSKETIVLDEVDATDAEDEAEEEEDEAEAGSAAVTEEQKLYKQQMQEKLAKMDEQLAKIKTQLKM